MEKFIIIFLFLFLFLGFTSLAGLIIFLLRKKPEKRDDSAILMFQQQLNHISQILDSRLSESGKVFREQFKESSKIIRDVTEKLTRLDDTNRQIINFADQLKNLQDILKNPKHRGVMGEYFLETVLKNILPVGSYQMQYSFRDGTIVDAVIFVEKRIIPVDSKFSLENYNRMIETSENELRKKYETAFINDLKMRIEETSKYVKPEEKTTDFAFMFIPSEAVYYDLINNKVGALAFNTENLITYAHKKRVMIVSANTFVAFLQTVLQGLRNQKISEEAQAIIKEVEKLGKHLFIYSEYMKRLGSHLETTVNSYNKAGKELAKIDKDVVKLTGVEPKIKIKEIEGPTIEK